MCLVWSYDDASLKDGIVLVILEFTILVQDLTGKVPGRAASKKATCVFTTPPYLEEDPEKSLLLASICAWTSRPTTPCHFLLVLLELYKITRY